MAERFPHELSGGMKQRVCIAIAISLGPRVIIADEPTSALDVVTQRQVMRTLHAAQDRLGSAMILIGHDMGLMAQSVDTIAVMRGGELVEIGEVRRMFGHPAHPYTAQLIDSVPVVGGAVHRRHRDRRRAGEAALLEFRGVSKVFAGAVRRDGDDGAASDLRSRCPPISRASSRSSARAAAARRRSARWCSASPRRRTGTIRWEGRDLVALSGAERRAFRRNVQAVFQDPYSTFNPFYRVARSLTMPLRSFDLAKSAAEARERAEDACRQVGLSPKLLDRFPHQLSGGQRQRMMVARALMLRPRLLVADEPVSMVDASLRAEILDLLVELRDRQGITILYITHDLATAYRVSDEVLVLHKGRVVEAGAPEAVLGAPAHPYTRLLVDCLPWPDPIATLGQSGERDGTSRRTSTPGGTFDHHAVRSGVAGGEMMTSPGGCEPKLTRVFCFFSSEKKTLLPY